MDMTKVQSRRLKLGKASVTMLTKLVTIGVALPMASVNNIRKKRAENNCLCEKMYDCLIYANDCDNFFVNINRQNVTIT